MQVRVAGCQEECVKKVLDLGADGVIIPQTNSVGLSHLSSQHEQPN